DRHDPAVIALFHQRADLLVEFRPSPRELFLAVTRSPCAHRSTSAGWFGPWGMQPLVNIIPQARKKAGLPVVFAARHPRMRAQGKQWPGRVTKPTSQRRSIMFLTGAGLLVVLGVLGVAFVALVVDAAVRAPLARR